MKKHHYREAKGESIELESNLRVDESRCLYCKKEMIKYRENKSLFDNAITFHFVKFKCQQCKRECLDLEEAKKYDLFLRLKKMGKEKAMALIAEKEIVQAVQGV